MARKMFSSRKARKLAAVLFVVAVVTVLMLYCLPLGTWFHIVGIQTKGEIAARDRLAKQFNVASEWLEITHYVDYKYFQLGLTQAEVHERLAVIGPFTFKQQFGYMNDEGLLIDSEDVALDDKNLWYGLGIIRSFEYDHQTGLLVGTLKNESSGEQVRLLPPP